MKKIKSVLQLFCRGEIMKVFFHTLGCKVNQYETQEMREMLKKSGYEITENEQRLFERQQDKAAEL